VAGKLPATTADKLPALQKTQQRLTTKRTFPEANRRLWKIPHTAYPGRRILVQGHPFHLIISHSPFLPSASPVSRFHFGKTHATEVLKIEDELDEKAKALHNNWRGGETHPMGQHEKR